MPNKLIHNYKILKATIVFLKWLISAQDGAPRNRGSIFVPSSNSAVTTFLKIEGEHKLPGERGCVFSPATLFGFGEFQLAWFILFRSIIALTLSRLSLVIIVDFAARRRALLFAEERPLSPELLT